MDFALPGSFAQLDLPRQLPVLQEPTSPWQDNLHATTAWRASSVLDKGFLCQPDHANLASSAQLDLERLMRKNVPKEPTVQLDLHCQSIVEQAHTNQKLARPNSPIAWPVIQESTVVGQAWPRLMVPASDTTIVPVAICRLTLHNSCVLRDISVARELRLLLLVPRVISVLRGRGNHPNAQ